MNKIDQDSKLFVRQLLSKRYYITGELELKGLRKNRRNEEKFKFVTKRAIKYLFKKFKQERNFFISG